MADCVQSSAHFVNFVQNFEHISKKIKDSKICSTDF